MEKVIVTKEQVYQLKQYADVVLKDLENKIQMEQNNLQNQIDTLDGLLNKKEGEIKEKESRIQQLEEKIAAIRNSLREVDVMCGEVGR